MFIADSMSLGSPTGIPSPKEFDKSKRVIPAHVQQFSENLQHLLTGQVGKACTTRKSKKIVIYVCAADSQGKKNSSKSNQTFPLLICNVWGLSYEQKEHGWPSRGALSRR